MKKPPDPPLIPSPRTSPYSPQRPYSAFFVDSGFQLNFLASCSVSYLVVASRDACTYWVGIPHPLILPFPDPHQLPSSSLHGCLGWFLIADYSRNQGTYLWFDSVRRLGTRLTSWVFVTAYLLGDLGKAILDSPLSVESRSAAIVGVVCKSEAQISLRSSSPCFFFFVVVNLVDGTRSLTWDTDCSVSCLSRSTKNDYAQCVDYYDSGWVLNVSNSDLFEPISCIMNWFLSPLNCVAYVLGWPCFSSSTFWWLFLDNHLMYLLIGWVAAYSWMWIVGTNGFYLVVFAFMFVEWWRPSMLTRLFLLDWSAEHPIDLYILYPLSAIIGTVGSRIAVFVGCCYELLLGTMLVNSFGCHFTWTLWTLVCWWVYGLCIWIVIWYAPFNLIIDTIWQFWSESHFWIAHRDHVRSVARISVIPFFGLVLSAYFSYRYTSFHFLMNLFSIFSKDRFVLSLCWATPFLLPSLVMVNMYAQVYVSLYPCSCWHLLIVQNVGVEVMGKYLLMARVVILLLWSIPLLCWLCSYVVKHPEGGCFLLIMILVASFLLMWVKLSLSLRTPSLWLFRVMGSPYAQMLGQHCSSICWYLASLLNAWNEGKGQFPLVYEDVFSETNFFDLMTHPVSTIKPDLYSDAGIRINHCFHAQWPDSSVEAHGKLIQPWSTSMGKYPFLGIFLLKMSRFHMIVLVHINCTTNATVSFPSGCISFIVVSCNSYFVTTFEQHLRVLGPCRMALDMHKKVSAFRLCHQALAQHRRMLRLALRGFDITSQFIRIHNHFDKNMIMHKRLNGLLLIKIGQKCSLDKVRSRFMNHTSL